MGHCVRWAQWDIQNYARRDHGIISSGARNAREPSSSEGAAINCWRALANTKSLPLNEPKLGTSVDFHEFLLFMLWKAAESEQPFYENVNLGQMQNKLRDALIAADEQKRASFDVILSSPVDPPMCIVQPISFRIEGVRFVKFYLNHLDVLIKTDSRLLPESLRPLVMSRDAAWLYTHPIPRSPHLNQLLHATALNRQKALRAKKKRRTRENIP
jgi:hypothetical protein